MYQCCKSRGWLVWLAQCSVWAICARGSVVRSRPSFSRQAHMSVALFTSVFATCIRTDMSTRMWREPGQGVSWYEECAASTAANSSTAVHQTPTFAVLLLSFSGMLWLHRSATLRQCERWFLICRVDVRGSVPVTCSYTWAIDQSGHDCATRTSSGSNTLGLLRRVPAGMEWRRNRVPLHVPWHGEQRAAESRRYGGH